MYSFYDIVILEPDACSVPGVCNKNATCLVNGNEAVCLCLAPFVGDGYVTCRGVSSLYFVGQYCIKWVS